jgi:choline dehydrogenase-like flavoprotein
MGAPLTAEFADKMDAYDGLQISHYGLPRDNGYAYETWFNPPVAQALNMPGWFRRHYENMRLYDHLMAVGVIVGTEGNARVRKALTGGADIVYTPAARDLATMAKGLRQLAEILFAGGAKRVMLNTWAYEEFGPDDDLDRLVEAVKRPGYLTLGTGHPQGGNAMSRDARRGVVDPSFRVHGYDNLYVCDASVFPSSLTVNPQLTVMTLAHYAASRITVP